MTAHLTVKTPLLESDCLKTPTRMQLVTLELSDCCLEASHAKMIAKTVVIDWRRTPTKKQLVMLVEPLELELVSALNSKGT